MMSLVEEALKYDNHFPAKRLHSVCDKKVFVCLFIDI